MATFRKRGGKWQVIIRRKDSAYISKTYTMKEAAQEWQRETEVNQDCIIRKNLINKV